MDAAYSETTPVRYGVFSAALSFAVVGAGFLAALAVRLSTLGRQAFWYDEVITANSMGLGWGALVAERQTNGHFPTYFAILKFLGLYGSEFSLRLPSAVFDSAAGGLAALVALWLGGRIAACFCVALYAFHPFMIYYGQEARPYALLSLLLAIVVASHVATMQGRRGGTALPAVASIAAIWTIPAAILSVWMLHIAFFLARRKSLSDAERRSALVQFAAIVLATLAALGFLLPTLLRQSEEPGGLLKWQAATPASIRILEVFYQTYGFGGGVDPLHPFRFQPGWPLAAAFIILMVWPLVVHRRQAAVRYLGLVALGTPLLFLVAGIVTVMASRYLIGMIPSAIILVACGLASLVSGRRAVLRWSAATIVVAGVVMFGVTTLTLDLKYDWRQIGAFVSKAEISNTEIISNQWGIGLVLDHYGPQGRNLSYRFDSMTSGEAFRAPPGLADRETVWMILSDWLNPPDELIAGRTVCEWQFGKFNVLAATRDPAALPPALGGCPENASGS